MLNGENELRILGKRGNRMLERTMKKHPGFKAVENKIESEGYSKKTAGKILASKTRKASAKAKKANPRLKRVKG